MEGNLDVWDIFQLGNFDPWGISPVTVIAICRELEIDDVEECLYKMSKFVQELRGDDLHKTKASK